MTYNFFNPTDLAFGNKLTAAFKSLHFLLDTAEDNVKEVLENMQYFEQYNNRNYQVKRPTNGNEPCRTDEIFDIMNDKEVYIKDMRLDADNGDNLLVSVNVFDRSNNRMTSCSGSTELKEGYCYYKKSTSNQKTNTEVFFTKEPTYGTGLLLFQFRIDNNGKVNIVGETSPLGLKPFDIGGYSRLELSDIVAGDSEEYTATEYECLCVIGKSKYLRVLRNDEHIVGSTNSNGYISKQKGSRHAIIYVKPDDKISGVYQEIRRVKYL